MDCTKAMNASGSELIWSNLSRVGSTWIVGKFDQLPTLPRSFKRDPGLIRIHNQAHSNAVA